MGSKSSGRRPKPNALKILRGVTNQARLNHHEPVPPAGEVVAPKTLSAAGRQVWDDVAPIAIEMQTLTVADIKAFASFCELQATMEATSAQKDAAGFAPFTVSDDYNGAPVVRVHAALKLERETATALRPYYELFGLNQIGRARLSIRPKSTEPESKWAKLA